jgi:hypothetical protein
MEKTATPNQKRKWMTEEEMTEKDVTWGQLKLGQGCRTKGVGHATEEYAALLLGSEAKLDRVGEDTRKKRVKGQKAITNLAIPFQT